MGTLLNRRRYMGGGGDIDYSKQYLTFEALEDGTFKHNSDALEYSLDGGSTWVSLAANTDTPTISAGNTILWRGNMSVGGNTRYFVSTGKFNASGNPLSLKNGDNFINANPVANNFYFLFYNCTGLVSAKNVIIPSYISEKNSICGSMFRGCTSLVEAPELPATTLSSSCYTYMFYGCTSLIVAPELPATTLGSSCYDNMFNGCTSLTTAPPELPAVTLQNSCYAGMFRNCSSLVSIPSLLPATTLKSQCYQYMFMGCTSLTTTPTMAPTILANKCCQGMFSGCTSLENVMLTLPATTLESSCYYAMFVNTKITTAPYLPATTLVTDCYGMLFDGCSKLNYIKAMFTTTPGTSYTANWVRNVPSGGTFVKNSAATWADTFGNNAIPTGWTVETASS